MSRRPVPSVLGLAAVALAAVLIPTYAAQATPRADVASSVGTLAVDPDQGLPGASLTATVTITDDSCDVDSVVVNGTYVDTNGDDAQTDPVTLELSGSSYTGTLVVPTDAASTEITDENVDYTATANCVSNVQPSPTETFTSPPAGQSGLKRAAAVATSPSPAGTASVKVLTSAAVIVTVDPDHVKPGGSFAFTITRCTGGLVDLFFLDADGNDTDVPDANVEQDSATAYHGTFTVPTGATLGDGGLLVDCAQAASGGAGVRVFNDTTGDGGGAPIAVPVAQRPTFTG